MQLLFFCQIHVFICIKRVTNQLAVECLNVKNIANYEQFIEFSLK